MKAGKTFEDALEDNPLRPLVRARMEIAPLRKALGPTRVGKALQVQCGRGDSTVQLLDMFAIGSLVAVDSRSALVAEAGRRHPGAAAEFRVMDIPRLEFPDSSFDALFNLAELHNYARWREGLGEMARVLAPGGILLMDELSIESFTRGLGPYFRKRTLHPYDLMFAAEELREAMIGLGLEPVHWRTKNPLGLLPYLVIVARKR